MIKTKDKVKKMLSIAVLDDDDMYIDRVCKITKECMEQMGMNYSICTYKNGRDVLEELGNDRCFDIYLLDMELPDINGLEVAKQIRRRFSEPILIYITHHVNYSIEAYEVNAHRYILKTKLEEKLPQAYLAMGEALEKRIKQDLFYMVEHYGQLEKIYCRDIYYLKKNKKYVDIIHKDGVSSVRKSLGTVLEELHGEEFLIIDRSYAVNINYVKLLKDDSVHIVSGEILPVSRSKLKSVREAIMRSGE